MTKRRSHWELGAGAFRAAVYGAIAALVVAIGGPLVLMVLTWGTVTPASLWPQGLFFQVTVGMMIFGALLAVGLWLVSTRRDR